MANHDQVRQTTNDIMAANNAVAELLRNAPWIPIVKQLADGTVVSVNNFTGDKMAKYRLTQLACGALCQGFEELANGIIPLTYFYAHRIEMESQRGGEIIDATRVVLMDKEGHGFGFVSDFLARELDTIISIFGPGPWMEPINIQVVKGTSRSKRSFYTIQPVQV